MTRAEALAEARRRWTGARVDIDIHSPPCSLHRPVYILGQLQGWERVGSGPSWEAAFADADRRTV